MEVRYPSTPLSPDVDRFRLSSLPFHLRWGASLEVGSSDGCAGKLYVAVGKSPEKTMGLLRWAFRRFGCTEIELLHVHQLSPLIPTPLGKIPVNQANEVLVSSYRRTEREATKKVLLNYLDFCHEAQVHARVIVKETERIQNGIVDLVAQYNIRKLIMGSTSEKTMHDPLVAADGFTYEGRALRKRLDGGQDTSPMTNLKLDHVKLIPNHALRLAIED